MMKLVILEDEIPAYEKLSKLIMEMFPSASILGWGRTLTESAKLIEEHSDLDLILSDIELLDGNTFSLYEKHNVQVPIIFCTAFDQYIFEAFKVNGIAYILKPYTKSELREAIEKYQVLFNKKERITLDKDLFTKFKSILEDSKRDYKKRWTIKRNDGIKLINTEDIIYFSASGDFSFAFTRNDKHIINMSIGSIFEKLNPKLFFRINRSEIVNINSIEKIEQHFKNRLAVQLRHIPDTVYTSNTRTPEFRIWLEG